MNIFGNENIYIFKKFLEYCCIQSSDDTARMGYISTNDFLNNYNDVIMGTIASEFTSLTIVYSTVYSDGDQRKHESSMSLAFVRGIHRGPVNSPHKWPVTRKMFPFDDVIMKMVISTTHKWVVWPRRINVLGDAQGLGELIKSIVLMHYRSSKEYQAWLYKIHGTIAVEISMYPHAIEKQYLIIAEWIVLWC